MINTKAMVKVAFRTALAEEELQAVSSGDMAVIAEVPGLIRKIYHLNPETSTFGAVYHFENEKSAENYMQSPMVKDLALRYKTLPGSLHVEMVKVIFGLSGNNTSGKSPKITSGDWKVISTVEGLADMLALSTKKPVLLFKNSNKCPVGRSVLRRLDGLLRQNVERNFGLYILDVISHRDLSNKVAALFDVQHASPQVLLINNRSCFYHTSQAEMDCVQIIEKVSTTSYQFSNRNSDLA